MVGLTICSAGQYPRYILTTSSLHPRYYILASMPARTSFMSQLAWKRQHGCSYRGNQDGSASNAVMANDAPSGYSSRKGRIELDGELAPRSR